MKVERTEDSLHQQLQAARERLQDLYKRAAASPDQQAVLEEALAELSISIEELNVSVEELRQQNDELTATRQAVEAERQHYQELFDFAPDGYLVTDLAGEIRKANMAAARLLGVPQNFLIRKPLISYVAKEDHRYILDLLARLRSERSMHIFEMTLQPRQGPNVPVSVTVSAVPSSPSAGAERAAPVAVRWMLQDITARKRAEEQVRGNLRRITALGEINNAITSTLELQQILDFLLDKIAAFFPYPIAGTVRLYNRDKKLEYLASRNMGEDWRSYQPGSPGALGQEVIRTKAPLVVRNIQQDPRIVRRPQFYRERGLVSYLAAPLIAQEKVIGILSVYTKEEHEFSQEEIAFLSGVGSQAALAIYNSQLYAQVKGQSEQLKRARDQLERRVEERTADLWRANDDLRAEIAERQRVEDALRESEERYRKLAKQLEGKLIVSDRLISLGELAASFAHEFNNPLAIILGLAQEMRSEMKRSDSHYDSIAGIEQEALRCRKIVLDLLDFVRPKEATFVPLNLRDILEKTGSLLSVQFRSSKIETAVEVEPDLPPILADPQQLRQVLINLAFNAAEAMPDGGVLTLRAVKTPQLGAQRQRGDGDAEVTIAISDTGQGIDPEVLPQIFRPFFTTKKSKGMGLGLSICERIVKAHRGRIRAESAPGQGTTFYLYFPVTEARQ